MQSKSMDWFLHDRNLHHERLKLKPTVDYIGYRVHDITDFHIMNFVCLN